jgi:hypothetical protein
MGAARRCLHKESIVAPIEHIALRACRHCGTPRICSTTTIPVKGNGILHTRDTQRPTAGFQVIQTVTCPRCDSPANWTGTIDDIDGNVTLQ